MPMTCLGLVCTASVEAQRVGYPQSPTHLRSKLLNKGQMIPVKLITQVESVERDDMGGVLSRDQV